MFDIHNTTKFSRALSPIVVTDNTAQVSQILDTSGFSKNELGIITGTIADADTTTTLLLEESDAANMSGAVAVDDANLLGLEATSAPIFSDDDKIFKLGYKGSKRYIRATLTPANNTGNMPLAMFWAQSGARKQPTS